MGDLVTFKDFADRRLVRMRADGLSDAWMLHKLYQLIISECEDARAAETEANDRAADERTDKWYRNTPEAFDDGS